MLLNMDTCIPRPPALPPSLSSLNKFTSHSQTENSQGFRLLSDQDDRDSVYSIYKQKIDQMFETDSGTTNGTTNNNSVQAKIEKMFSDVARDNGILPKNPDDIGQHNFSVDYLGSVPLQDKVTSLAGLQKPLKDLYFAYKKNSKHKKLLTGRLEISNQGLKVQYQGDKGDLEQLNSFPTIAVWSAVKFVTDDENRFAFLPLITDPDNIDKNTLFRQFDENEEDKYLITSTLEAHSPLFAVVMRKIGIHKQLECHGFVCQTSEDAIVIAATLYKSLMAHMKAKEKKPKSRNGITCMSITSSSPEKSHQSPQTPIRPPRKKRSTASSVTSGTTLDQDLGDLNDTQPLLPKPLKKSIKKKRAPKVPDAADAILPYEEPITVQEETKPKSFSEKLHTFMSKEQKQITEEIKQVLSSKQEQQEQMARNTKDNNNSGDILTKVTIPRSGSFLNAGGLTRYKSKVSSNGKGTGGSPLGFNELFNEFRLQEGLHSMDEILGVIIDPEGMSFNDLKPIYKEFLLKLSVTLTKDELYQRSKLIMRRHKKKMLKRSQPPKHLMVPIGNKFKRLKHIFQRNLKLNKVLSSTSNNKNTNTNTNTNGMKRKPLKTESSISTSSYDTRHFTPKIETKPMKKKKPESTSEDSDFFSMRRKSKLNSINHHHQNRNSSSGYVSCSECSYDSDTCTCVSADKCYCSLGQQYHNRGKKQQLLLLQTEEEPIFCGCDTDSCTESNKCYCQRVDHNRHKKRLCKRDSNTKSTRSLEYMHNPSESYYEKLKQKKRRFSENNIGFEYDLFNIHHHNHRAIYSRALSERQASMRSYGSTKYSIKSGSRSLKAVTAAPPLEALSVKKSAEIAALFADIKLSQTTDISHLKHSNCSKMKNHDIKAITSQSSRVVQNSLYRSSKSLYNTRNGLYTIQSQSDESRRSSVSDKRKRAKNREFFGNSGGGQSLENSLGYLP